MKKILLALALTACGKPEPTPTPAQDAAPYVHAADRLAGFYDDGFVVTRTTAGVSKNQGDALIWTGEAVYALDCARGEAPAQALAHMVQKTGGALYRHSSLPSKVSMDGALGFYRAVAKRVRVCGEADRWRPIVKLHLDYMAAHDGLLNAGDSAGLDAGFAYVRDRLAASLDLVPMPSAASQAKLEGVISTWVGGVMATHAACFRINLALTSIQTIESLGDKVSAPGRESFCVLTRGSRLPTTDAWCGREDLAGYLSAFVYDQWQYRHQRCAGWESPDGNGDWQPAVDFLVAWADYHGTPK